MKNHMRKTLLSLILWGFLLGVRGEYVALWADEDPEPVYISSVKVSQLPPADQIRLRKGIPVKDLTALARLLEDYRDFFPAI